MLRRRLHCAGDGAFAAVVNDYGCSGLIIDLRRGKVTIAIDGGDYFPNTVPFSFAFATVLGRTVAIHRTAWNRLDVSDPLTGELITQRGPTHYRSGEERPAHYLDYFHGGLYVSPNDRHILDDGWVWHPVGIPTVWRIERWISENPWESEDGPSKKDICARDYYWDHGIAWLDERRVAVGGIGDDDIEIIEGARVFDVTSLGPGRWGDELRWALEIKAFPGPAGTFFSDGTSLFSSNETGLSRWDPEDGSRTMHLGNFRPTHYHRTAQEFAQLVDNTLVRWSNLRVEPASNRDKC